MSDGTFHEGPRRKREWDPLAFVGGVWLLLTVAAIVVANRSATPIPWVDDWQLVEPLTGETDVPCWLWTSFHDHRIPLPRLILYGIYRLNNGDFRVAPFAAVIAVAALSLLMIGAAWRIRGRVEFTDAIFPLALFNIDREIMFATLGVNLIPSTFVSCMILVLILNPRTPPSRTTIVLIGVLTWALAMCGSSGAAQVPVLALWLGFVGRTHWRLGTRSGRHTAFLGWAAALFVIAYVAISFPGFKQNPNLPPHPGIRAALRTSLEFLSTTFGPAAWSVASESMASKPWFGLGVAVLTIVTAGFLGMAWIQKPEERIRIAGLGCMLVGMIILALGLGWARTDPEPGAGYARRYAIYASPLLFSIYFAWDRFGGPVSSRLAPMLLLTTLCALFTTNVSQSLETVRAHTAAARLVERDLLAGIPPDLLAERHAAFLMTGRDDAPALAKWMRQLHRAGLDIFRQLHDAKTHTAALNQRPERLNQMVQTGTLHVCQGNDPFMVFTLGEPTFVLGIRVRCRYDPLHEDIRCQLYWRDADQDFSEIERTDSTMFSPSPEEQSFLTLVNRTIVSIRLDIADRPCTVSIAAVELILP